MTDSRYLPVFESNCLVDNEELLRVLRDDRATLRHVSLMCSNFRRAAIASLLKTGRSRLFRLRLQRSGTAFAFFLTRTSAEEERVSEFMPLLDAIGAGDFETAGRIARSSHHRWVEDEEYEENFLFYEFLMQYVLLAAPNESLLALLKRWEACLAGTVDRRLDVCQALLGGDSEGFDEALAAYLDERQQQYAEQGDLLAPEERLTEGEVSIEALAFVRVARRKGLVTQPSYHQVPAPTLDDEPIAWSAASYEQLD